MQTMGPYGEPISSTQNERNAVLVSWGTCRLSSVSLVSELLIVVLFTVLIPYATDIFMITRKEN